MWLHINPEQKMILKNMILFEVLDTEQYPEMLNNILYVVLNENKSIGNQRLPARKREHFENSLSGISGSKLNAIMHLP